VVRKLGLVLMILVIAASLVAAACGGGGGEEATPTPAGQTPAPTQGPSVAEPVDVTELEAFVPAAPSGWQAGAQDPHGITYRLYDEVAWTWVYSEYTNVSTGEVVSVNIYDAAYHEGLPQLSAWKQKVSFESSEGYARTTNVDGHPAWETYSKPDSYGLMVFTANRFLIMTTAETKTQLEQFSNLIDYDGLAGLS
jgi:hypothetical protein